MVPAGRRPVGRASSSGERLGPSPAPPQQTRLLPRPLRNCQKLVEPAGQRRRGGACGAAAAWRGRTGSAGGTAGIASPRLASLRLSGEGGRPAPPLPELPPPAASSAAPPLPPSSFPPPAHRSPGRASRPRPRRSGRRGPAEHLCAAAQPGPFGGPFQEAALLGVSGEVGGKLFLPAIKWGFCRN